MQYHVIDVFTDKQFSGNPAGVCLLDKWLKDEVLQNIAAENKLSETAFLVKNDEFYDLRWFTPALEMDLCGHATIASAFVLFEEFEKDKSILKFKTLEGFVSVSREKDILYLDFPSWHVLPCPMYKTFEKAFGVKPIETYKARDFLIVLDSEETVRNLKPDLYVLTAILAEAKIDNNCLGVIVTAKSSGVDFVSRVFAPWGGIDEDPVTGSTHCELIPFWSKRLNKKKMIAKQLSKRGGALYCEDCGERVKIGGKAVRYLRGEIKINV